MNYFGIERLLATGKRNLLKKVTRKNHELIAPEKKLQKEDISIAIANMDGTILYSDPNKLIDKKLPLPLLASKLDQRKENKHLESSDFIKYQDSYFIKSEDSIHKGS